MGWHSYNQITRSRAYCYETRTSNRPIGPVNWASVRSSRTNAHLDIQEALKLLQFRCRLPVVFRPTILPDGRALYRVNGRLYSERQILSQAFDLPQRFAARSSRLLQLG